jgi:hypothetical protein
MISSIKRIVLVVCVVIITGFTLLTISSVVPVSTVSAASSATTSSKCSDTDSGFLGFPTWYRGLVGPDCTIKSIGSDVTGFITHVALNIVDIIMRLVVYVAVFFIMYGGFQFLTSQGSADGSAKARTTITNAIIGLVIAILAIGIINFVINGILK